MGTKQETFKIALQKIEQDLVKFLTQYKGAEAKEKEASKAKAVRYQALLKTIRAGLKLNNSSEEESEAVSLLKELLEYAEKEIGTFDKKFDKIKNDFANTTSQAIKGGTDLLKALF